MTARGRFRVLTEGPCALAAGPDETIIRGRLDDFVGNIGIFVLHSLSLQPIEVFQALIGVQARLGGVGVGATSHHEVVVKIFGRICKARGALHWSPTAAARIDSRRS